MTNNQTPFSKQDFALAHLLVDTALVETEEVGDPASAEELAIFVEGSAEATLGQLRTQQIIYQLSQNQELYDHWLDLCEFRESIQQEATTRKAQNTGAQINSSQPASIASISKWFVELLRPQPVFAALLGAIVTAALFTIVGSEPSEPPALAVTEGDQLPVKARMDSVDDAGQRTEYISNNLVEWFHCSSQQQQSHPIICYSKSAELQHWLAVLDGGLFKAIPPPVEATRITGIKLSDPLLAIEYLLPAKTALSVFKVTIENQQIALQQVYEDNTAPGGFFEAVNVTATTVTYDKVTSAGAKESKQYAYKEDS